MPSQPTQRIKTLQLITAGMIVGVLALSIFAVVFDVNSTPRNPNIMLLATVAVGAFGGGVSMIVRASTIRALQTAGGARDTDRAPLERALAAWATFVIIRGAALEATGLLGAVSYIITKYWPTLLIAALVVAALIALFPTAGRLESFYQSATGRLPRD
jgi:hypothetical protein